ENVTVDEVEHFDREILKPLATDQQNDRKVEPPTAHQVDQRRGLAFQTFLAPVDHHAAVRSIHLHLYLRFVQLACPDSLETVTFDLSDDLVEAESLQIVGVEDRRCEQEGKASEIVHVLPSNACLRGVAHIR